MKLTRRASIASWTAQVLSAAILGQTLFFKLTGAPEARYIFETLGVEPFGRIGAGVAEFVTVILLLVPRTAVFGALLGSAVMVGAIGAHLGPLGIEVNGDGGQLFAMGVVTLLACLTVLFLRRGQLRRSAGEHATT